MSSGEKRHRSYFVSSGSVEVRPPKLRTRTPALEVVVEKCAHGLPLGKFCLPCADERSARNRIDVV